MCGTYSTAIGSNNVISNALATVIGTEITTNRDNTVFVNNMQIQSGGILYLYDGLLNAYVCVSSYNCTLVVTP